MPIYVFLCRECGYKFELLAGMTKVPEKAKCPECGSLNVRKGFASFGISGSKSGDSCAGGSCSACSQ